MAEGAGAAGLAAMLAEPERFAGRKVGLILCGGNIDPRILASIMVRELERDDRIVSFRLTIPDRPGILGQIASRLGELGANILGVDHHRLFLDVPAKGAKLDVTMETRDGAHAEEIFRALRTTAISRCGWKAARRWSEGACRWRSRALIMPERPGPGRRSRAAHRPACSALRRGHPADAAVAAVWRCSAPWRRAPGRRRGSGIAPAIGCRGRQFVGRGIACRRRLRRASV